MAPRNRKSVLSEGLIRELLFAESEDEYNENDDSDLDEFILSEKENSSTSDEEISLEANTSILGKSIIHSMRKFALSPIESMRLIFFLHLKSISNI